MLIVYIYFNTFQRVDEEEYGGITEILKEGLMTSFSSFMVSIIFMHACLCNISIVVCTDLSGEELYRQVGVSRLVASKSLRGVIVSTLAQNADVSVPTHGAIFPIFITPTTIVMSLGVIKMGIIVPRAHFC